MRSPRKFLENTKIQHPEVEIRQRSCRGYGGDNYLFLVFVCHQFQLRSYCLYGLEQFIFFIMMDHWSDIEIHHHVLYSNTRRIWREKGGGHVVVTLGSHQDNRCGLMASSRAKNHLFVHPTWVELKWINSTSAPFPIFCLKAIALRRQKAALINLGNWNYTIITPK